jgi:hypothetical protein
MTATRKRFASAAVGGLLVMGAAMPVSAQILRAESPVVRSTGLASGSILGVVRDDRGAPVPGAVVSAVGATRSTAITDKSGRFELARLAPGPYHVRAHCPGYVALRSTLVQVNASDAATSTIAMRRSGTVTVLAAGAGTAAAGVGTPTVSTPAAGTGSQGPPPGTSEPAAPSPAQAPEPSPTPAVSDQSETVWRLRHGRRGVLKEVTVPIDVFVSSQQPRDTFQPAEFVGRAVGTARAATSFFTETPFSGQVNLLMANSFDAARDLFTTDALTRNRSIAYVHVAAPVGEQSNWSVRGAMNQADITSWIVAGAYTTGTESGRHQYHLGLSYSTQRYDGGNVLALRDVTNGSRNVGRVYGFDNFALSPSTTLSYGAVYSRYDYLNSRGLVSPRVEMTVKPAANIRMTAAVSRRALVPGAEEFVPPGEAGIWLPPQRTFSSLAGYGFEAERTLHAEVGLEGDLGPSTFGVKAFRQHVDDQLVTIFGADLPHQPAAQLGHYLVGNVGDVDATGYVATFRTGLRGRVHGSLEYTLANAVTMPFDDDGYLLLLAPTALRLGAERIHDLAATIETEIPETATRLLVLYRVGNGFATHSRAGLRGSDVDTRFDVQIHQALPFLNFSSARWEMLLAVRNFFREDGWEQSVYDERLVVRPPKRVVGGVTLRF